jgi:hypothetical protein
MKSKKVSVRIPLNLFNKLIDLSKANNKKMSDTIKGILSDNFKKCPTIDNKNPKVSDKNPKVSDKNQEVSDKNPEVSDNLNKIEDIFSNDN